MINIIRLLKIFLKYPLYYMLGGVKYAKYMGVTVGDNCRIYIASWGTEPFLIRIGDNVTITSGVRILTHDGSTCLILDENGYRYQKYNKINIGNNVFIGVNTIITPNVSNIGNNVIVAAGSIVTKNVDDNCVIAGNPARKIKDYDDYNQKIRNSCISSKSLINIKKFKNRVFYCIENQKNE